MKIDELNESIKKIKAVCEEHNACIECPMNWNCNEHPAKWNEVNNNDVSKRLQ